MATQATREKYGHRTRTGITSGTSGVRMRWLTNLLAARSLKTAVITGGGAAGCGPLEASSPADNRFFRAAEFLSIELMFAQNIADAGKTWAS